MRKSLAVGILLVLLGSLLIATAGHSTERYKPQYAGMKVSFARIVNVQNGGEVDAYVLAVEAPLNASRIRVVNYSNGVSYLFERRNGLFYPRKHLFFKDLYIENLSWKARVTIYTVSGNYADFLNVSDGRFIVSSPAKNFGGIAFPCNHPFVFNVSDPRGTVYGDSGKVLLLLRNDSFIVLNESYQGTPLSLQVGCDPGRSRIGYTLLYRTPFNGYVFHSGAWGESMVVLGRGFSFRELNARQNITAGCSKSPRESDVLSRESTLWGIFLILLGLLLIYWALRRPYKDGERRLKR